VQANLVVLQQALAADFQVFCERNPAPCPLIEITGAGSVEARRSAPGSDLRTDLPRYCVIKNGEIIDQPLSIDTYWQADLVAFLIGCSFTFDTLLLDAGLPVRHVETRCNVPMFRTNLPCHAAGPFAGTMVVSMRPMKASQIDMATGITRGMPGCHGAPVHVGDPGAIGIKDTSVPDFGDAVPVHADETCAFWACGVTPMQILQTSGAPFAITHAPGHMFVTDDCLPDIGE
jgi:uncharacterized protein YcsI (UPF0317 family)